MRSVRIEYDRAWQNNRDREIRRKYAARPVVRTG